MSRVTKPPRHARGELLRQMRTIVQDCEAFMRETNDWRPSERAEAEAALDDVRKVVAKYEREWSDA